MKATESSTLQIVLAQDDDADLAVVPEAVRQAGISGDLLFLTGWDQAVAFIDSLDYGVVAPRFNLLLLDLDLRKHDCEDVLKRLSTSEWCAQRPVIVTAGSDVPQDCEKARTHATLRHFPKPSSLAEFVLIYIAVRDILLAKKSSYYESDTASAAARDAA
jgi:CheY-like chemotaxis protein